MRLGRSARIAVLTIAAGLVPVGCGSSVPPSLAASPPVGSPSGDARSAAPSLVVPSLAASGGPSQGASTAPGATAADPGLFSIIALKPADALTFQYDGETTARVATDQGLAKDASAIAIGLYTVTGQQPVVDYAIASILRLRDPKADGDWFRSYRDSYDESACAQASGVTRHAEAPIAGRTVFIGACAGGAFTYHLRLDSQGLVVSITGVGPGRLGEQVAGLVRP